MSKDQIQPSNFIRHIIDKDLQAKKYTEVHTRFPPEPNGYLHIGHAKSICLNFGLAQDYQGKCNLRFDDTNPEKESIEYINAIKQDVRWLGFTWDGKAKYSSHYFDVLYEQALSLIKQGLAYVCFLDPDEAREYRGTLTEPGKNSPYRDNTIEENLKNFEKMKNGEYKEGECVLRAKIDMTSPFMVLRDPTMYRIRFASHHQSGDAWCIYPMYDFTHCISDAIEGISHSLCTLEFQDNRRLYDWFLEHLDLGKPPRPYQYEFSRLNLEYTIMSKRKLNDLVAQNLVTDWDDPRMPTISGMRRRGYSPQAIVTFCERIGVSKQDSTIGMDVLENLLRDDLNVRAKRTMAVLNPIKLVIENYPEDKIETLNVPNHPQDTSMGKREIFFSKDLYIDRADFKEEANNKYRRLVTGKEVRLRNAYVIKAVRVEKNSTGEIDTIYCSYDPDTLGKNPADGRKIKGVIHFVEASKAVTAKFRLYDRLFNVANPAKAQDFTKVLNPDSLATQHGFVEPQMQDTIVAETYQFEREGYFCKDQDSTADNLIFNRTVTLRDTWNT